MLLTNEESKNETETSETEKEKKQKKKIAVQLWPLLACGTPGTLLSILPGINMACGGKCKIRSSKQRIYGLHVYNIHCCWFTF